MEVQRGGLRWTSPGAAVEREQKHRQLVRFARAASDLILSAIGLLGQQRRSRVHVTPASASASSPCAVIGIYIAVFLPLPFFFFFFLFIPLPFLLKYPFSCTAYFRIALHWLRLLNLRPLPPHYAPCSSEAVSPHRPYYIPHHDS